MTDTPDSNGEKLPEPERRERASAFAIGETVGSHTILASLGRGGVGEIFLAEDSNLGRKVALKVLPPELNSDEHRKRFEREAKAVAALNHPNIVQIYAIRNAGDVHYLTMELVIGKTLTELIPDQGMPVPRIAEIGAAIAGAIAAAHERGIIHRDLKPENIMIDDDGGAVKILDFGLAPTGSASSDSVEIDLTAPEGTSGDGEGAILDDVSYLSPERAQGRDVDPRTDVFSLGVILYQMATGKLPFRGDTPAAVLASIVRDTPIDPNELRPRLPQDLARIIKRSLAKAPERRYRTMLDLRHELDALHRGLDAQTLFRASTSRARRPLAPVMAAVVGLLAVVAYLASRTSDVPIDSPTFTQLTQTPDEETFPTLSPDGRFIAYSSRVGGSWDIFLLRVNGQRPLNLTETADADETQPAFSPDGSQIVYRSSASGGGIFVMGAAGESARQLTDFGWNPAWSPDSSRIVFATEAISRHPFDRPTTSALWIIDADGGEPRLLSEGDAVQPTWSPNGELVAYWGLLPGTGQRDLYTVPIDGGMPNAVTRDATVDWNPVWGARGDHLYFASERGGSMNLWRVPVSASTGRVRGEPEPLTVPASFASHISLSGNGERLVYVSSTIEHRLFAIDFDPDTFTTIGEPWPIARDIRDADAPAASPTGEWLVFSRSGREDILISGVDGTSWRQLTDDPFRDRRPVISPDGMRIAFYSNRGGSYEIWVMGFDGTGLTAVTHRPEHNLRYPFWSPDGTRLGFSYPGTSGVLIDVSEPGVERSPEELPPYPVEGDAFVPIEWSRDGARIVGYIFTADGLRAGIATLELDTGRYEKLTDFGWFPAWAADSEHVIFMAESAPSPDGRLGYLQDLKLFVVNRTTKAYREFFSRPGQFVEMPTLSYDNRTLYYVLTNFESDIWLMSFDGGDAVAGTP